MKYAPITFALTASTFKRQDPSDITRDTELATSMLAEVKTLISSLTHHIAKRQAITSDKSSPAKIDALIDSLHKLLNVSTLKGGVAKRQDTANIDTLYERLEALMEPLKAAASILQI